MIYKILESFPVAKPYITNPDYLNGLLDVGYGNDWRKYHNYDHIIGMVKLIDPDMVFLDALDMFVAILFHDVVYDVKAVLGKNERESANLACRLGPKCIHMVNWNNVERLILATNHLTTLTDTFDQLIADYDLATFGGSYDEFSKIGDAIIEEYCWVYAKDLVLQGRIQFLNKMLAKEHIFYTTLFSNDVAKENIEKEIKRLTLLSESL